MLKKEYGCMLAIGVCIMTSMTLYLKLRKKKKKNIFESDDVKHWDYQIGALHLHLPQSFRDELKNDVLIEESIKRTENVLYIYISNDEKEKRLDQSTNRGYEYISRLFADLWNEACFVGNPTLDFRIQMDVPNSTLNDVDCEFVEEIPIQKRNGVQYIPLQTYIKKRIDPELIYFDDPNAIIPTFNEVVLGGTFDHLHNGHKKLLYLAASICKSTLIIGVTSEAMLSKKQDKALIQDTQTRSNAIYNYLQYLCPDLETKIFTIDDPYGPAITRRQLEAIVVSSETIAGAFKINEIRKEKGMTLLKILVSRRTNSSTLSSSYIRTLQLHS